MFGLFKKKPKEYAVANLVENVVLKDSPTVSPLKSAWESYTIYTGRLKQSLVSGNVKMQRLCEKYLKSNGITPPTTVSECDDLIAEIQRWQ